VQDVTRILKILSASREKFLAAIHSVPDDRWRQRPHPDTWSPAEVSAHVTMVERFVNKNTLRILGQPPASVAFLKRIHLPAWISSYRLFKVKSPFQMRQDLLGDKSKHIELLADARKKTTDILEANRNRDLSAYRAPHPLLGSLNLYGWHEFIAYHEDRHRKQLLEIVEKFQL
jgi:hypothetical protein